MGEVPLVFEMGARARQRQREREREREREKERERERVPTRARHRPAAAIPRTTPAVRGTHPSV